jgi:hypothetical protein
MLTYLNIEIATILTAPEFADNPAEVGIWLRVAAYAATLGTRGVIADAKKLSPRQFFTLLGVQKREVAKAPHLLTWENDDLFVRFYPADHEERYEQKCDKAQPDKQLTKREKENKRLREFRARKRAEKQSETPDETPQSVSVKRNETPDETQSETLLKRDETHESVSLKRDETPSETPHGVSERFTETHNETYNNDNINKNIKGKNENETHESVSERFNETQSETLLKRGETQSETVSQPVSQPPKPKPKNADKDEQWLAETREAYAKLNVNVDAELIKAQNWCRTNNRECTKRFFDRWLSRAASDGRPLPKAKDPNIDPVTGIFNSF